MASIDRLVHEAYLYQSDDELLGVLVPFLREGQERGDAAIVDLDDRKTDLLRSELGPHAADVEFVGGCSYTNPASAIREHVRRFESLVAVGEVRTIREVSELPPTAMNGSWHAWRRYEAAINVAFNDLPIWRICLFDRTTLPRDVVSDVLCTHPRLTTPRGAHAANELYVQPRQWLMELPLPLQYEVERTAPLVTLVNAAARDARAAIAPLAEVLSAIDRDGLLVGVSEVVSNALAHGEPPVTLRAWASDDEVLVTVDDCGPGIDDPFAGLVVECRDMGAGGRGLWMAHQLCGDVALMNHSDGFRVRLVAGGTGTPRDFATASRS